MPDINIGDCGCCGGETASCDQCEGGAIAAQWEFDITGVTSSAPFCDPGGCEALNGHFVLYRLADLSPPYCDVGHTAKCCYMSDATVDRPCETVGNNSMVLTYDPVSDVWNLGGINGLSINWSCPGASFNCLGSNVFTGDGLGYDGFGNQPCVGWPTSLTLSPG